MLSRLQVDVLSESPDLVTVLGGANDLGQSIPAATTIANLGSIVTQILATGATVALGTVPPRLNTGFV
jgi:lysophospholipase L1-like esterase